jgi:hypothetical protein
MKRLFSFALAVIIGWGSITQPARAFAPVAVLAAPQIVTASGVGYALSAMAGVIGLTGLYFTVKDAQDNAMRVPLGPGQNNQPPEPFAPPTAVQTSTGGAPTDMGSWARCIFDQYKAGGPGWGCGSTYSTYVECASGFLGFDGRSCINYQVGASNYGVPYGTCSQGCQSTQGQASCPSGYSVSGSSCVLQNARQATDDKTCDMLVSNGQFSTANDMNCPSSADGTKLTPMLRNGKVIAYGQNASGQPLMWEVSPGAQSYTVKQYEQIQTPSQTQVKTTTVTVDSATSAVTSVQTSTSPGSISSPSAASAPTVTTTQDPATSQNTPTVQKDETKPADLQTCGLPGSPACNVNDDGFQGKDAFVPAKTQEINDQLDAQRTGLQNSKDSKPDINFSWLPSVLPGDAVACQPLHFDFSVNNRVMGNIPASGDLDICSTLEFIRNLFGYLFGVITVFYVWRNFTTGNKGE